MKFLLKLLLGAVAIAYGTRANATVYEAKTVTMATIMKDTPSADFVLIGETSDGCQIWSGLYPHRGAQMAFWTIDSKNLSAAVDLFGLNTKYELNTDYATYMSYPRSVTTDSTNLYFVKVKSAATADVFAWDGTNTPDFLGDFRIEPNVTLTAGDVSCINDRQALSQTLTWNVEGLGQAALNYIDIELSYDGGHTWTSVNKTNEMSGNFNMVLPLTKDSVRYRATAYANEAYRLLIEDDRYVSDETPSTNISNTSRIAYNAGSVVMTVGTSGSDINMSLLGVSYDGCQVWACRNTTGKYRYTHWTIDGVRQRFFERGDLYSNTLYHHMMPVYNWLALRDIPDGSQYMHYIKVYAKNQVDYFNWDGNKCFHATGFYMPAKLSVAPVGDIAVDENGNTTQKVMWSVNGINTKMLGKVTVETSSDNGKTWNAATDVAVPSDEKTEYSAMANVAIPANATKLNYRLTLYPKDEYWVVVEDGCWTATSEAQELTIDGTGCTMEATALHRANFTDNADATLRTIKADVKWTAFEGIADKFEHAEIQYSTDNGKTWAIAGTVTTATGEHSVNVPVGYTQYKFRIQAHPKAALDSVALLRPTATSEVLTTSYAPAVTAFAADGNVKTDEYGKLATLTVNYELNDDLYQTRGKAYLSYSYDNGQTWHQLKGFAPNKQGSNSVTVEAAKQQCKLRLEVESVIDGEALICTQETGEISL